MSDQLTLFLVNATFVVLVAASALTWAIVIVKLLQVRRLTRQGERFESALGNVAGLPTSDELKKHEGPTARLALAGAEVWEHGASDDNVELVEARGSAREQNSVALEVRRDLLERGLKQQLGRERRNVEAGLPLLASVGSTAPFIGLFGTVLGIIHALTAISGSGSASLEVVAGPIGEALIATAVGIAVAVPAVLAYNYFLRRAKSFSAELEDFANTFVSSAIRSSYGRVERNAERSVRRPLQLGQEVSA
jgi:biopolymer transport protein ExbB